MRSNKIKITEYTVLKHADKARLVPIYVRYIKDGLCNANVIYVPLRKVKQELSEKKVSKWLSSHMQTIL